MGSMRLVLAITALLLASLNPAVGGRVGAGAGAIIFHAAVGGSVRDSGTVTAPIGLVKDPAGDPDFNGCAIISHKAGAYVGAYTFEIHLNYLNGTNLLTVDVPPQPSPEVYLRILNYRAGVASAMYDQSHDTVNFAFAMNGRTYGTTVHVQVTSRNGGRDGTISSQDAARLYPAVAAQPLSGVTIKASWHCATVLRRSSAF